MRTGIQSSALAIASLFIAPAVVAADIYKPIPNAGDLVVYPLSERPQPGEKLVIGGKMVLHSDFPASFYSESNEGSCTSTLIGPQAMVTAAHCVGNGKNIKIKVAGTTYEGACDHHTDWKNGAGDESADYALCLLKKSISGVRPETVKIESVSLTKEDKILLAGFGCVKKDLTGGNDGEFRVGLTNVSALPGASAETPNDLVTLADAEAPAIVCPGDSGGLAFLLKSPNNHNGDRCGIGLNSRVGVKQVPKPGGKPGTMDVANGLSYVSALFTAPFQSFIEKWKEGKVEICGFSPSVDAVCHACD